MPRAHFKCHPVLISLDMVGGRRRGEEGEEERKGGWKGCVLIKSSLELSPKRFETVLLLKLGRAKSSISHTR